MRQSGRCRLTAANAVAQHMRLAAVTVVAAVVPLVVVVVVMSVIVVVVAIVAAVDVTVIALAHSCGTSQLLQVK